jgi:hypothetical protein
MNGQEQRERQTAVARLEQIVERMDRDFHKLITDEKDLLSAEIEARVNAMGKLRMDGEEYTRTLVGEERTHRLQLAEEQRRYVDRNDRMYYQDLTAFRDDLNLWGRLRWLLTGGLR